MTEEETHSAWQILRSLKALLVITAFLLTVVIIIVVVLEIQVQARNSDIKKVKSTLNETKEIVQDARQSSDASQRAIDAAIRQGQATSVSNKQFVADIQAGLNGIKANTQTLQEIEALLLQLKGQ